MNNKQFAKAFLKDNGQTPEEKDRWIGAVLGEELTKYIEWMFPNYEDIHMVAQNLAPLNDWVKDKFREITKKNPDHYDFELISRPAFERWCMMDFAVRFKMKPWRERIISTWDLGAATISTAMPTVTRPGTMWVNHDGNTYVSDGHHWEQTTTATPYQPNYAEQLEPLTLDANGIRYNGVTVTAEDVRFAGNHHTWQAYPAEAVQPIRVVERYGASYINTDGIATARNIDFMPNYNHAVNVTAVDGGTNNETE
jgi:hypothetical protein